MSLGSIFEKNFWFQITKMYLKLKKEGRMDLLDSTCLGRSPDDVVRLASSSGMLSKVAVGSPGLTSFQFKYWAEKLSFLPMVQPPQWDLSSLVLIGSLRSCAHSWNNHCGWGIGYPHWMLRGKPGLPISPSGTMWIENVVGVVPWRKINMLPTTKNKKHLTSTILSDQRENSASATFNLLLFSFSHCSHM